MSMLWRTYYTRYTSCRVLERYSTDVYEYANDALSIGRKQIGVDKAHARVNVTEMFTAHTSFKRKWLG